MGGYSGHYWATAVGILGDIGSFMVYLAPLPTFYQIYKKKSTEGFQSVPYMIASFSAMLYIYYGLLKSNDAILITINSIPNVLGFNFGVLQMVLYVIYKNSKKVIDQKLPELQSKVIAVEGHKLPELTEQIIDVMKLSAMVCSEIIPVVPQLNDNGHDAVGEQNVPKQTMNTSKN
ncbi:unnamed protein product [Ilex paraguariensis]|uniref:Bidirectional sugar transporter SWEET n=1 Tax=Ilex paraguariensis TaxID=185542 RepID=A0ABC8UR20_9AQUA